MYGKQIIMMMIMIMIIMIIIIIIMIIIIVITVMQREHPQDAIALAETLGDVFVAIGLKKVEILNRRSSLI